MRCDHPPAGKKRSLRLLVSSDRMIAPLIFLLGHLTGRSAAIIFPGFFILAVQRDFQFSDCASGSEIATGSNISALKENIFFCLARVYLRLTRCLAGKFPADSPGRNVGREKTTGHN